MADPSPPPPAVKSRGKLRAEDLRAALLERLDRENEDDLFRQLEPCGSFFDLICTCCGETRPVERHCMRRWCPVCARIISARRVRRYHAAARCMRWPLFVTLTAPNLETIEQADFRAQRRAFGLLRGRKIWTERVTGGVAGFEVTNRGKGWHLHLHALIDCKWLAWYTRPPATMDSKSEVKRKCKAAATELATTWAKCLKRSEVALSALTTSVKVKRTTEADICVEILKYAVKMSDILECEEPIGDLLRAMQGCRLVTSFGALYGAAMKKMEKAVDEEDGTDRKPSACSGCGGQSWMTEGAVKWLMRGC